MAVTFANIHKTIKICPFCGYVPGRFTEIGLCEVSAGGLESILRVSCSQCHCSGPKTADKFSYSHRNILWIILSVKQWNRRSP
jgi:hypothetical protein